MALFKPLKGTRASLDSQPLHEGYAYFCTDDGSFHIDFLDADGNLQRKQLNAKDAETLCGMSLDDIKAYVDEATPQSDWSINDPANPAYVQNRTHWADAPQTHVLCDSQDISLVYDAENAISEASFSFVQVPNMENPFIFVFDGTSYDVRIQRFGGARVGFGNLSIANKGEDSGEPFVCSTLNGLNWTISTKDTSNTTHTIESYYITQECHQLDRKYLPDDAILPIIYEEDNGFTLVSQDGKWCVQQPVGMSTGVGGEIFNSYYGDFINEAGVNAHAEGETTKARGQASHTAGQGTIANSLGQYVYGTYNIEDDGEPELPGTPERGKRKYAHIVGNGDNNSRRSNAHTLAWDGTAWFAGNVKVGGTGQDDANAKTLATTEYVDTKAGGWEVLMDVTLDEECVEVIGITLTPEQKEKIANGGDFVCYAECPPPASQASAGWICGGLWANNMYYFILSGFGQPSGIVPASTDTYASKIYCNLKNASGDVRIRDMLYITSGTPHQLVDFMDATQYMTHYQTQPMTVRFKTNGIFAAGTRLVCKIR